MAQITEYGYQKLRDFVQSSWKYVELRDESNNAIIRLGVGDSRVTWLTHSEGASKLKLQIVIKGSDVTLPKTFAKAVIFDVASGGTIIAESTFTNVTLTQSVDEITVISTFTIPVE